MILDIVQIGDPVLRRKAHKITQIDRDIRLLAEDMVETLHDSGGVGLAAPQIGESIRMIVVEYPEDDSVEDSPMKTYKVINPEIIWRSEETQCGREGCLSLPGRAGIVTRPKKVRVRAQNRKGEWFELEGEDLLARAICHELDHLDGVLYIDEMERELTPEEIRADDERAEKEE